MNKPELSQFPYFKQLNPETQRVIGERLVARHMAEGQTLLIENGPAEFCYFIRSGILRAYRINPDGRIQVLARFTHPEPINIISLLSRPRQNRATIDVLSDADLYALSAADFESLITHHPDFSTQILQQLAGRIGNLTDKIASLSLYPIRTRLARFIIHLANGEIPGGNNWTQDEIAAEIGTTRDIVGRMLREFEDNGLIARERSEILLLNKAGLYQIAEIPLT